MNNVKNKGVVFTPEYISDFMVSFVDSKNDILEPSCGEGIFIKSLIKKGYNNKNIIGNDINSEFIKSCKNTYSDITLLNQDFTDFDITIKKYKTIIGNPPYIRIQNLPKEIITKIKKEYPILTGNLDIYIYFILKCIDLLDNDGKLIFIIPNSFLHNKSCHLIKQQLIDSCTLEYVIDFQDAKIFNGFSVYTCIIVINKKNSDKRTFYKYSNNFKNEYINVNYKNNEIKNSLLNYINIKNGIATLCDDVFIIKEYVLKDGFYSFNKNNKSYKIEKELIKKIIKISKKQEYHIIYPYIDNKIIDNLSGYPEAEKYLLDNKQRLLLRDKGNKKYERWWAYGRKQGITISSLERLFISSLVPDIKSSLFLGNYDLFYSGLTIEIKSECNFTMKKVINILKDKESIILKNCNIKSGGWYSLSKSCFDINI
jgi:adenine-specific DNA-methyltransferase